MLEMRNDLLAPCSPLAPPHCNRGVFQVLVFPWPGSRTAFIEQVEACLQCRGLPCAHGIMCSSNNMGLTLHTPAQACVAVRGWAFVSDKGAAANPPCSPCSFPGQNMRMERLLFPGLFLSFDFSSWEKQDCNISVPVVGLTLDDLCNAVKLLYTGCCVCKGSFAGVFRSQVELSCEDVGAES